MATRSTIKFYAGSQKEPVLSVYQHCDGYIGGVGYELANWLNTKKIINGVSDQTMEDGFANGMGCLAAQFVAAHKNRIGSFYVTTSDHEEDYDYKVTYEDGGFVIEVDKFKGSPNELLKLEV